MGILRSCMSGEAAEWFDRKITGKNWELAFINSNGGAATANVLSGMTVAEGANEPNVHVGIYVPGSTASLYSVANPALTLRQAFIPPHDLTNGDECWTRCGARPTNRQAGGTN